MRSTRKKVIAFHQSGLEKKTGAILRGVALPRRDLQRIRALRNSNWCFLKKTMSKTVDGILGKSNKIVDFA